jgi:hypothetical protein
VLIANRFDYTATRCFFFKVLRLTELSLAYVSHLSDESSSTQLWLGKIPIFAKGEISWQPVQ